MRRAQGVIRLAEQYGANRLEASCLRAVTYDNYDHQSLRKILEDRLDEKNTKSFSNHRAVNPTESAYIRPATEYSSDMEINYEH